MHDFLVYLIAMVILVPISKYAGLGSVIGYLIAGFVIGPQGLNILHQNNQQGTSELAEFGVIMMLLLIGLELNPRMLWKMRGPIFGLGSLQVLGTLTIFSLGLMFLQLPWNTAIAIGLILSVSSTAIAMQTLQEKGYAKSAGGMHAFSVLLFQDLAVIPMLALLPFLGLAKNTSQDTSALKQALLIISAVVGMVGAGRFAIHPVFKRIGKLKLRETFTALALLIVAAAATLMHAVGLSPALGAFLAGVVLADSEFRHQIHADIEPFKGLLLGLFFMTIGSNLQLSLIVEKPLVILAWVLTIVLGKAAFIYGLGRASKLRPPESLLFAAALAQGGEFAFVLIAQTGQILSTEMVQVLATSIAISMALAPLFIQFTIKFAMSRFDCQTPEERLPDEVDEAEKRNPVLVVGIGRFGQTLVRFLKANRFPATVLDMDSEQIDIMARFGIKSYFGDGSNPDLLRAAGLDQAKVLVLAIDEPEQAINIVELIRPLYPNLPIYTRAYDRIHAYRLLHLGVTEVMIETSGSAVFLGIEVLKKLGVRPEVAQSKAEIFHINNQRSIRDLAKRYHQDDRETFIQASKEMSEQLEALLRSDPKEMMENPASP